MKTTTKTVNATFDLPASTCRRVSAQAKKMGISVEQAILAALAAYLGK